MDENPTETLDKAISAAVNRSIARRKDQDASVPGRGSGSSSIKESAPASARVPSGDGATGASTRNFRKTASPYGLMYDSDPDSDCLMPMFSGIRTAASKASPQAPGAFKQRQITGAPPGSTAAGRVSPRQTRHPPWDGGYGVGNDSKDSSGSEFEEMMVSSRWFSLRSGGPCGSRAKNTSIIGSADSGSGKRDARTNGDNNSNASGGKRGVTESEEKAHGGKRKRQPGELARRRRRRGTGDTKKSRRARGLACASGEAFDAGSFYSDFSSSSSSGNITNSANGDALERDISSTAKGKSTDRTRESRESSSKRSGAAAQKPSQSPERRGKSPAGRAERRSEAEHEHRRGNHDRGNKGVANGKGEDAARRQDGPAGSGDREAYGVGDPADRRDRKPARGSSGKVQASFDDTNDSSGDSADFCRRASRDGSGNSGGSGGDGSRFGFNFAVGRRRRSGKGDDGDDDDDDDDDFLDDEEKLKPTLNNPPFEDPEMRPLVLENEYGGERAEVPAAVNRYLRGFQRDGVRDLERNVEEGAIVFSGCHSGESTFCGSIAMGDPSYCFKESTGPQCKSINNSMTQLYRLALVDPREWCMDFRAGV